MIFATLLSALITPLSATGDKPASYATPDGPAKQVVAILAPVLSAEATERGDRPRDAASVRRAIDAAMTHLQPQSPAAKRLASAVADDNATSATLMSAIRDVHDMLTFKPVVESEMPEGFPTYTPVGMIQVKSYPVYRKATANGFWTLFRHIQSNSISMTAPVEMEFTPSRDGALSQQSMAFLYGSTALGRTGRQGSVEVSDSQPLEVVSVGVRGRRTPQVLREMVKHLEQWLADNPEHKRVEDVRVLGYNSPFVAASKQYFEVQIPIARVSQVAGS